jgi:hypothetical protein
MHQLEDRYRDVDATRSSRPVTGMSAPVDLSTNNFNARAVTCVITDHLVAKVRSQGDDIMVQDVPLPKTFATSTRHSGLTAQELSERRLIRLTQAHEATKATAQNCIRSAVLPLSRRYQADRVFEKPLLRGNFTMDGRCRSINGNRYAQVFANKDFFATAFPLPTKSGPGDALRQFISECGRPE